MLAPASPSAAVSSALSDPSQHPRSMQSIAGRLYYPAASSLRAAAAAAAAGRSSWPSLLLRPWQWRLPGVPWLWDAQYARGLCGFLFFRLRGHLFDALKQVIAISACLGWLGTPCCARRRCHRPETAPWYCPAEPPPPLSARIYSPAAVHGSICQRRALRVPSLTAVHLLLHCPAVPDSIRRCHREDPAHGLAPGRPAG